MSDDDTEMEDEVDEAAPEEEEEGGSEESDAPGLEIPGPPPIIDIEALLQPISDDNPVGTDPREDVSPTSPYYQIKDARNAARAQERLAEAETDPDAVDRADWSEVLRLAPVMLTEQAKDLEIAAWYIEALLREYGLVGLRDGFVLVKGLVDRYWDGLYPLPDEEEPEPLEARVAPLAGLNGEEGPGTLIVPIGKVAITDCNSPGPYTAWQYQAAVDLTGVKDEAERERRIESGTPTLEQFAQSASGTPPSFFRAFRENVAAVEEVFRALDEQLTELCGYAATPPTSQIREALEKLLETFQFVTRDVVVDDAAADEGDGGEEGDEAGDDGDGGGGGGGGGGSGARSRGGGAGPLETRDDAFKTLQTVSDFFRRTEPHSPLSYILSQAIRWGRMPLPELLTELIDDESARHSMFRLAGIQPPSEPEY